MPFDFKKAFDLIDHAILVAKLGGYELPPWLLERIADFLTDRKQRVKLAHDCYSDWGSIRAGVPQGTKLGVLALPCHDKLNQCRLRQPLEVRR